jgi:hypothetical protein
MNMAARSADTGALIEVIKKTLIVFAAFNSLVIAGAIVFALFFLPAMGKARVIRELKTKCPACILEICSASVSLLSQRLVVQSLFYRGNPASNVYVEVKAQRVRVPFRLRSIISLDPLPDLGAIHIEKADITVFEDERNTASPSPKIKTHWLSALPIASFQSVSLADSTFCYTNISASGQHAKLHVNGISAVATGFATRSELSPARATFTVTGTLEKSGDVLVASNFDLYAAKNLDHLHLRVLNAPLAELNIFFREMADVSLAGAIVAIDAKLRLRQGYLDGIVTANYRDFELTLEKTKSQSGLAVFLKNLVQSIMISDTRPRNAHDFPRAVVSYRRGKNVGLIKMFLNGLVPAVKTIISG